MLSCNRALAKLILVVVPGLLVIAPSANGQKKGSGAAPAASSPSTPSQGATASNAPFEVEMLSYGSLDQIMEQVADYACGLGSDAKKVVVLDGPALQSLEAFDSFYVNAEALTSAFESMTSDAGAAGVDDFADITNAVVAAATSSTSESSSSFTISDPTAALVLLQHLRQQTGVSSCLRPYYAGVYAIDAANPPLINGQ